MLIQPPNNKSLSPAAKQQLILSHIHGTGTCHTLKELEKTLPAVASINGMQVKEYLQALVDENQIRVEKIGSVNWYWSFASEAKREREKTIENLKAEVLRAQKTTSVLEIQLKERLLAINAIDASGNENTTVVEDEEERMALMQRKGVLSAEMDDNMKMEAILLSGGAAGREKKMSEIQAFKEQTSIWTDNIYIIEQHLMELAGGDREAVDMVKREYYGDEYSEEEGLKELDFEESAQKDSRSEDCG
jgi:hypothetical protein